MCDLLCSLAVVPESPIGITSANRLGEVTAELHALQAEMAASKAAFYAERERAQQEFAQQQNRLERQCQALLREHARLKFGPSSVDGC